jgi:hypothetical protein
MSETERIKELEDKLNEKTIENDDLKSKVSNMEQDYYKLKIDYTWLSRNYQSIISILYDELDEITYKVKHSNLRELLQSREEENKSTEQKPNS